MGFCFRVIVNKKPLNLDKATSSVLSVLFLIYDLENENVLVFFTPKVNFKYLFIFFKSTHFLCSFSNNSLRGQSPWYYKKSLKIFKLLFINCWNFLLFTTKPSLVWRGVTSERNVSRKNAKIFVRISQNFAFFRENKFFATFFFAKMRNAKISQKYFREMQKFRENTKCENFAKIRKFCENHECYSCNN